MPAAAARAARSGKLDGVHGPTLLSATLRFERPSYFLLGSRVPEAQMQQRAIAIERNEALTSAVAVAAVVLLTAGAAQVSIDLPGTPVPQTLGERTVVLGGSAYLGARAWPCRDELVRPAGPVFPVLCLVATTVGTRPPQASCCYSVGFVLAGYLVGTTREALGSRWEATVPAMLMGSAAIYVPGLLWL